MGLPSHEQEYQSRRWLTLKLLVRRNSCERKSSESMRQRDLRILHRSKHGIHENTQSSKEAFQIVPGVGCPGAQLGVRALLGSRLPSEPIDSGYSGLPNGQMGCKKSSTM